MKIKSNILLMMTASALVLTACQSDDRQTATSTQGGTSDDTQSAFHEINFQVNAADRQSDTRAVTFADLDRLQSDCYVMGSTRNYFSVTAYMDGETDRFINSSGNIHVLYSGTGSTPWHFCTKDGTVQTYFWPETIPLNFFAFHPCQMEGGVPTDKPDPATCLRLGAYADRTPQLECTALPLTNIGQATLQELIYAYTEAITYKDYGGYAPLTFQHPLAAVSLTLSSCYPGLTLTGVTFKNIYNNGMGVCSPTSVSWTTMGPVGSLVLSWNKNDSAEESPTYQKIMGQTMFIGAIDGPFLVLPQALTDRDALSDVSMEIKYIKRGEIVEKSIELPMTDTVKEWLSGKHYIYQLELGKDESIIVGCVVEEWADHGNTPVGIDEDF